MENLYSGANGFVCMSSTVLHLYFICVIYCFKFVLQLQNAPKLLKIELNFLRRRPLPNVTNVIWRFSNNFISLLRNPLKGCLNWIYERFGLYGIYALRPRKIYSAHFNMESGLYDASLQRHAHINRSVHRDTTAMQHIPRTNFVCTKLNPGSMNGDHSLPTHCTPLDVR